MGRRGDMGFDGAFRDHEVRGDLGVGQAPAEEAEDLHILAKLDLHDRAQAVVTAYETGLVRPGGAPT